MNEALRNIVNSIVEKYFNNAKLRMIGPRSISHSMTFQSMDFDPKATILNAYLHASTVHTAGKTATDPDSIRKLIATCEQFIDSIKTKTQADSIRYISDALDVAKRRSKIDGEDPAMWLRTDEGEQILDQLKKDLDSQRTKIVKAMDTVCQVELSNAQNIGAADGILSAAQSIGISDPIIFKIGILDQDRCPDCWRLWTLEDRKTPRVYKMSELVADPGKKSGSRNPSITLTHPWCRDVTTVLMPGFGFDGNGRVKYIGNDHDEFKRQRGL